ncbi:MAG: tetratricopeptide repeat protein [Planctomycetota bacterium]|jgi:hypothetical protein
MKCSKQLSIILTTILIFLPISSQAQNVVQQLRDAYEKENSKDFDGAIRIYQQVISDSQAEPRQLSRAYYRLGRCYIEKGEKEKAAGCFEYVIENFPEQRVLVDKSKKDLQALGPISKETPLPENSTHKLKKQDVSETKGESGEIDRYESSGTEMELFYDHLDTEPSTSGFMVGGFAVLFDAKDNQYSLKAIRLFCDTLSTKTYEENEKFQIHVCDKYLRILSTFSFPLSIFPVSSGNLRWTTLDIPPTPVPQEFFIWVRFPFRAKISMIYEKFEGNPSQNRSIYIPYDEPKSCTRTWGIRAVVDKRPDETILENKTFNNHFLEAKLEHESSKSKYPLVTIPLPQEPVAIVQGDLLWAIDKEQKEFFYGRDLVISDDSEGNTALFYVYSEGGNSNSWADLAFQFNPRIKDMKEIIGTVKYYTAEGIEDIKSDTINFQEGSQINKPKGIIKKINKKKSYTSLTLMLQLPREAIDSVKFYDEQGKELESKRSGGSSSDTQSDFLCRISEQLPEKGYIVFRVYKNAKKHVDLFKIKDTFLSKLSL